jgi:hypothetical protein
MKMPVVDVEKSDIIGFSWRKYRKLYCTKNVNNDRIYLSLAILSGCKMNTEACP